MKINLDPRLGTDAKSAGFLPRLNDVWREIAVKINGLAAGEIDAVDGTATASPSIAAKQGTFIRNSTPTEQGSAGSKYVVLGWVCVASGNPGTFKPCRVLTGG